MNRIHPSSQQRALLEIGRTARRIDGLTKTLGTERYAVDEYPENLLWVGAKRAGVPHARIKAVDVSKAEAFPGVVRVLTGKDVPGGRFGKGRFRATSIKKARITWSSRGMTGEINPILLRH